jgi:hypothetical protein
MSAVAAKIPFAWRKVPHGIVPGDERFAMDSTDSEGRAILGLINGLHAHCTEMSHVN